MPNTHSSFRCLLVAGSLAIGCGDNEKGEGPPATDDHGPIADGIMAPMGQPLPTATDEELATFARGRAVTLRRFDLSDGLGPAYNVTFCGACHEKPVFGGSAGLYRNFFIAGTKLEDGAAFTPGHNVVLQCGSEDDPPDERDAMPPEESNSGIISGVVRQFYYGDTNTARPDPEVRNLNVVAQRNPIPFFGVGLLAELPEEEILKRSDPDDRDGDGISGRPNEDRGFVGRFGVKAQTVSIEGFIRGPLFNHLGLTTDPLSEEQRARLPIDSSTPEDELGSSRQFATWLSKHAQAAAPSGPNCDVDAIPDPEMSTDDLFDLVSFAMLLAAPEVEPPTEQSRRGTLVFGQLGCDKCHTPRLEGPRGPLHVYSDLLLHDMGPALDDGLTFGLAETSEFRTQPLWGLSPVGPYLHDGRARTIDEAIRWHGGEGQAARDRYVELSDAQRADLIEFLESLGGRVQYTPGLLLPDAPTPAFGEYGGPSRELNEEELADFRAGLELFDREFGRDEGVGGPRMNGDSCRACHFEPVIGGAGPRGVNVMRHGIVNSMGGFVPPSVGTILHKTTALLANANFPQPDANVFEHRQTPHLFGLGLIESIEDATIIANADPADVDMDGVSGRISIVDDGRLGRFGWKAQVPTIQEFVRDAVTAELGMTLPFQEGLSFGRIHDNDDVPDPEFSLDEAALLERFLATLGAPPRQTPADAVAAAEGEALFTTVECAKCHIPSLPGADGPVPLFSDLLLHEILPPSATGIEEASANVREFRTPPLWGLSQTAPYLHSGKADTLEQAILAHDGEAINSRTLFEALSAGDQAKLIQFLETL